MTQYFGDFPEDASVYIPFNTFDSNDPSASVTITNLVDADIKVHKDGSATQIVTDGATVAIDFDTITGNHLITVDTSAHADYSVGSDYQVRIEGTTVDGATINAWVGSFSIENRFNEVDVTKWNGTAVTLEYLGIIGNGTAQGQSATTLQLASGTSFGANDIVNGATIVLLDGSGQSRLITDWVDATDTATVDAWTTTPSTPDYIVIATPPASASSPAPVDVTQWKGTAVATPATAGIPDVNTKNINNAGVVGDGNATPWDGA